MDSGRTATALKERFSQLVKAGRADPGKKGFVGSSSTESPPGTRSHKKMKKEAVKGEDEVMS